MLRVSMAHSMFRIQREISKEAWSESGSSQVAWNVRENGPVLGKMLCFNGLEVHP